MGNARCSKCGWNSFPLQPGHDYCVHCAGPNACALAFAELEARAKASERVVEAAIAWQSVPGSFTHEKEQMQACGNLESALDNLAALRDEVKP